MKKTNYYEISKQKLKYLNYSEKTINVYLFYINLLLNILRTKKEFSIMKVTYWLDVKMVIFGFLDIVKYEKTL
jgi:hypothetical protein